VPGVVYEFAPHLAWSPDGEYVAAAFRRTDAAGKPLPRGLDVAVLSPQRGVIWATDTEGTIACPQWVDSERLIVTRYNLTRTEAEYMLVHAPTGHERLLWIEQEPKGLPADFVEGLGTRGPILSPHRNEAILIRSIGGWDHLGLLDLRAGTLRQITFGECEDSSPRWSPDGHHIAYLSNGHPSLSSLDVWAWDKSNGDSRPLTSLPGGKDELAWSPDGRSLSFLHAGPGEPPGLWLTRLSDQKTIRLTRPWPPDSLWRNDVQPQEVWIEVGLGHRTPGLLYTRPELWRCPAIIWLHGGPGTQFCLGWPTDYGSCIHHAFHQFLVQQGYSVLYLNYRGSTGYGTEHQQSDYLGIGTVEPADVAGAAHLLASLPQVDGQRLCVAGRSYGGFAALCALARWPNLFRLGIVIAGLGDLAGSLDGSRPDFWDDTTLFRWRIGWSAEQNPAAWSAAKVLPDLDKLQAPLVIFHGEQDQAVRVEEARQIEWRCRELGKRCFAHYYAGEDHVFSSAETWRDVFTRTLAYLDDFVK
jgi:dipeptidyl aminopeptidase/acylaminoacyl peptidase